MARRQRRRRIDHIDIDLGITQDDLIADLDPGWASWRDRGAETDI